MDSPLPQFLRELGFVLLEHRGDGLFAFLSPQPAWLNSLWNLSADFHQGIAITEKSPFLENFLVEADAFWASHQNGLCESETWIETSDTGKEVPLKAIALQFDGKRVLALHSPEPQFRERVQLLQTARNALLEHERLQREIQKKEILLHCIIHDLSQPLSVMSVAFDSMEEESVSERGKGLLALGRKATDQQLSMIRDILQVFSSDLKASLAGMDTSEAAPNLLVSARTVHASMSSVFASKNIQLRLDVPDDARLNWQVRGESSRIERIFSNLLENALRYSPPESQVTIRLSSDGEYVRAEVDDEGPGLPKDLPPSQIFSLFSKGKEGGGKAGLGLYFCRLTVERWGGSISCESLPTKGSRFWFRLPKASAVEKARTEKTKPITAVNDKGSPKKKSHPMRILLADDQDEIRLLTTNQLERSGHSVLPVANGKEAFEAARRERFDVVLLDEDMPVLGGLQALKAIRELPKESVPKSIIALTGYNSEPDRARLQAAGFDFVIGKPFRLDMLERLLGGDTGAEPNKIAESAEPPKAQGSPFSNVLDRVGGDEKLARQMVATFLRDTPPRIKGIANAAQQKNGSSLASLAHALKGSVAIFGAVEAHEFSERLQEAGRRNDFGEAASLAKQLEEEIAKLEANLRGYAGRERSRATGTRSKTKRRHSGPKRSS